MSRAEGLVAKLKAKKDAYFEGRRKKRAKLIKELSRPFEQARQDKTPFAKMSRFAANRSPHVWNYVLGELAKIAPPVYDQTGEYNLQLTDGEYKRMFPTYSERYIADAALGIASVASPSGPNAQDISEHLFDGPTVWNAATQTHDNKDLSASVVESRLMDIYVMAGARRNANGVEKQLVANSNGFPEGTQTFLIPTAFGVNIIERRGPKSSIDLRVEKPIRNVQPATRRVLATTAA